MAQQGEADRPAKEWTRADVQKYRSELAGGVLDVSLLRKNADYPVASSPEALAAGRQTVAGGIVDGWQQGPATASYPGGPLEYRVIMRVRITDPVKGAANKPYMPGNMAYIEFDQGAVIRDAPKPAEEWKPEKNVSDFEASIPAGTKVVVFPRVRPPYSAKVVDPGEPLPAGAQIMSLPPQGWCSKIRNWPLGATPSPPHSWEDWNRSKTAALPGWNPGRQTNS
ncbi:hypothetical protein DP939_18785 [Spongiactinospora rosea]|uniref:Uncharacterized protein n=1 Tax=Spongiactinospora rosea TaxID=2248750 RepID=A0A366LX47_9ACTN|nr:hypothetical protein [Spongiactinospora rosea]RBQ18546.1 hypothetical protein DP939_18785 [Spongiactinospora rosea]